MDRDWPIAYLETALLQEGCPVGKDYAMPIDDAATGDAALRARSERAKNPALLACDEVIASIRKKANRNKRRARASALLLTAGTALIPVSLVVS